MKSHKKFQREKMYIYIYIYVSEGKQTFTQDPRGKYNKKTEDCDGETQRTVKTMFIS